MINLIRIALFTGVLLAAIVMATGNFSFFNEDQSGYYKQEILNVNSAEDTSIDYVVIEVNHEEIDRKKIFSSISKNSFPVIIDLTWTGNEIAQDISNSSRIYYIKVDVSISPILKFLDSYLDRRSAEDVAIIFDDEFYIDQSIYYWHNKPKLRVFMATKDGRKLDQKFNKIVPLPSVIAVISNTKNMMKIISNIVKEKVLKIPDRFIMIFTDILHSEFNLDVLRKKSVNFFKISENVCCLLQKELTCVCPENFNIQIFFFKYVLQQIILITKQSRWNEQIYNGSVSEEVSLKMKKVLQQRVVEMTKKEDELLKLSDGVLEMKINGIIEKYDPVLGLITLGNYRNDQIITITPSVIEPIKKFYRVGITFGVPWTYEEVNPITGERKLTGYCIDFIQKLSEIMKFDYELVIPKKGTYGNKDSFGEWDGIVGDLVRGETEISVSNLVMTAAREEVIDFVAPYFEEGGISIVMRKPVRKTSLFKFMTVLKLEVWLSILLALTITAIMIWFLDKYSPYSAKNNKSAYNYPCRDFTLKESFWFALTSFTPQGGGEAPKSLSGRTLVAAYWLFVVLMLATFTANLAAFLTVERMQTPVQSLEQLARQSRINYTVVENSSAHHYFINMKFAEDTLYRMWKELTLNSSPDDSRYRVWDYPIKEQYGRILIAINDSIPMKSAQEGFLKVNERTDADFAFIHDYSEIKYEISKNCNLTEVGEPFALRHYAVAIQQGSHLHDDLSLAILELQKGRFLDYLKSKYWNNSLQENCPDTKGSEGITLESLGGVFIATLFGLALAMVTLVAEVLYYKLRKNKIHPNLKEKKKIPKGKEMLNEKTVTIGKTLQLLPNRNLTPQISYIPTTYPRNRFTKFEY